jgi:predicted RNase H-like HicB family nuclease
MIFIATIEKGEDGFYVSQINEIPAAISQGKTISELNVNLLDALNLILGESTTLRSIEFQY